jgi:hypothetical protein
LEAMATAEDIARIFSTVRFAHHLLVTSSRHVT